MKTKLITISMFLLFCSTLFAQREQNKIGYVDMDYILENIPDYKEANNQLNQKIETWKGEIELQQQKIRDLKENLENERPLLTQDLIDERQDEIEYYQKKMLDYQQEKFGPEGDMIAQRRQILQPIQDEVFNAVQEIGDRREYDFIFDSSADALMLFSAPRHDISDQILAGIRRHSRKLTSRDNKAEDTADEEEYKSVIQARLDKEKEEERESLRQEKLDERQEMMDERQRKRDSTRAARQEQFQARRDSLQRARNQHSNHQGKTENSTEQDADKQSTIGQENITETHSSESSPKSEEAPERETKGTNNQNEEDQRETRQQQREERQKALQEERAAQRDSLRQARQEAIEKRKKERDSINKARKLERKNRNK
ncbi:MAG TPA: OmpH family outer membrane protein [Flavobacteriaceae bacterium]|nr:OmpH family outer membrane protein [Flavobacteriaceae bacterium]